MVPKEPATRMLGGLRGLEDKLLSWRQHYDLDL